MEVLMSQVFTTNGTLVTLTKEIGQGGKGSVHKTNSPGNLAKIFLKKCDPLTQKKLAECVRIFPQFAQAKLNGHPLLGWPNEMLVNNQGEIVGFLMPEIPNSYSLDIYTNPKLRKHKRIKTDFAKQTTLALYLSGLLHGVHQQNVVVGDLKPNNFMVENNSNTIPSLIDCDSSQLVLGRNVYPCDVTTEGYTPPELHGKKLARQIQTREMDNFRLAVIIYEILFNDHPFSGRWIGSDNVPSRDELIYRGYWPYANRHSLIKPGKHRLPLNIVHPSLQQLFLQCFNDGLYDPSKRPTPAEWGKALKVAHSSMKQCSRVPTHVYDSHSPSCYWCDFAQQHNSDLYPDFNQQPKTTPTVIQNQNTRTMTTADKWIVGGVATVGTVLVVRELWKLFRRDY